MSIRTDQVQIDIDFITDESRNFAKTLNATKQFNQEIDASKAKIKQYERELSKAGTTEAKRAELLAKVAAEEKKVADNLGKIAQEGKKVEALDLTKLTPAQLVQRAKQLEQTLKQMSQTSPQFRQLQGELAKVNTQLGNIRQASKGIQLGNIAGGSGGGGLAGIAGLVGRGTAAIAAIGTAVQALRSGLAGAGRLEQLNIAFETFLGSADEAKRVLADLKAFEVETPFEAEQVNQAGRALLAFGFSSKELIPILRQVGDVASGTGKDFNELVLIYGKAAAQGKIQGEELNQLAEAGIPIYKELAAVLKVPEDQIRKLGEQGKISFKDLQQVFANLTSEGGRFAGLMERQSKSLDGLFSTLASAIKSRLTGAIGGVLPIIKEVTTSLINLFSSPVSEELEKQRRAFNGLAVEVQNTNVGEERRVELINALKNEYPEYLKGIDAEKVTNEQLQPILDKINQSYIIRIALQKEQEKLQPLLEAQADAELRLSSQRVSSNQTLARAAELTGIKLSQYKTEQEQIAAVTAALKEQALFQRGSGQFAVETAVNEQAKLLRALEAGQSGITIQTQRQKTASEAVTKAEQQRQAVIEDLRKTYGDLVADIQGGDAASPVGGGGGGNDLSGDARAERIKKAIELELKEIELGALKREVILGDFRAKDQINEERYQAGLVAIQEQALVKQLEAYKRYGQDQTAEALKIQKDLQKLQSEQGVRGFGIDNFAPLGQANPGAVQSQSGNDGAQVGRDLASDALQEQLRAKFEAALITEGEYNVQRLELQRLFLEQEINAMKNATVVQTDEIKKREEDKLKIEEEITKQRLENQRRSEEIREQLIQEGLRISGEVLDAGIELLSKDEAARKKNATAIKAFEIAKVNVNFAAEASAIALNAQKSPIVEFLGPVAGNILAGIQIAIAFARATANIAKINSTKFARGGFTGFGFGTPDETGFRPAGVVHEGEYVIPKWMVRNPETRPTIAALESRRVRGYADGGLVTLNTTPNSAVPDAAGSATSIPGADNFASAVQMFYAAVAMMPKEVRARVVLTELEDASGELNQVRNDAAF